MMNITFQGDMKGDGNHYLSYMGSLFSLLNKMYIHIVN